MTRHVDLSAAELAAISDSFALAHRDAAEAGSLFYRILFRRAPQLRPLFRRDPGKLGLKCMDTLNMVVPALDNPGRVQALTDDLARRHVAYGVEPVHYAQIGPVLIAALSQHLRADRFPGEARCAWIRAYAGISGSTVAAAYPRAAA